MSRAKAAGTRTVTFTAKRIASLPGPGEGEADPREWTDAETVGLRLLVRRSGVRTFAVRYKSQLGRLKKLTIGPTPPVTLKQARDKASEVVALARLGGDPQGDLTKARRADTVEELVERFLEAESKGWRPATAVGWTWSCRKRIIPELGKLRVSEIKRPDIRAFIDDEVKRAPVGGRRTFEVVRRIFTWAESRDLVERSPCHGLKKADLCGEELKRDRNFTDDELRRLVAALDRAEKRDRDLADVFRVIPATGTRSAETRAMAWADVDLASMTWVIPGTQSKNKEPHVVPLVGLAAEVVKRRAEARTSGRVVKLTRSPFVFPAPTKAGFLDAPPDRGLERLRKRSKIADLRLHNVRRTVRTRLAALGVAPIVAEKVMGHALRGVLGVYDQHSYATEVRAALSRWAEELHSIVAGKADEAQA